MIFSLTSFGQHGFLVCFEKITNTESDAPISEAIHLPKSLFSPQLVNIIIKWGKSPPRFKACGFSASLSAGDTPATPPKTNK
jgi:hypothetical protein